MAKHESELQQLSKPWKGDGTHGIETFEDLIRLVGPLGWWQIVSYFFIWTYIFLAGPLNMAVVYDQIPLPFSCDLPAVGPKFTDPAQLVNLSMQMTDQCRLPTLDDGSNSSQSADMRAYLQASGLAGKACPKFTYAPFFMQSTIVSEWDLVCDRMWYVEHSTMVQMVSYQVGSGVAGVISDKFGRKPLVIIPAIVSAVAAFGIGFSPSYVWFLVYKACLVALMLFSGCTAYCLGTELTIDPYRKWIMSLFWLPYSLGFCALTVVASLIQRWDVMHIVISLPLVVTLVYWWTIPESPRFLLVEGRVREAERELRRAARMNGKRLPDDIDFDRIALKISNEQQRSSAKSATFFFIFRYKKLAIWTIASFYCWFSMACTYYGVSLNVFSFPGNLFTNNSISAVVEVVAAFLSVFVISLNRQRISLATALFAASFTLLIVPWLPASVPWLKMAFAMAGKLSIYVAAVMLYLDAATFYPTVVRNSALAANMFFAGLGAVASPYISGLSKLVSRLACFVSYLRVLTVQGPEYAWMPMTIMGVLSLPAAVIVLFKPTITDVHIPDHIEEAAKQVDA